MGQFSYITGFIFGVMYDLKKRVHPRAQWAEYNDGAYFVTVCTKGRHHFFGHIDKGIITLSPIGMMVDDNIANITQHHPNVTIPQWIIMPNHIHAIITVGPQPVAAVSAPATPIATNISQNNKRRFTQKSDKRQLLSVVIGGIKAAATRYARKNNIVFGWQSGFHDRIIRDTRDIDFISNYIKNNPSRWNNDCFNTAHNNLK